MDTLQFWATVLSPLVGVVAIIVAFIISHHSSWDTKRQIDAIYNLLDVFVAAQSSNLLETKRKYEHQLPELNAQIDELKERLQIVNSFRFSSLSQLYDEQERKREQRKRLEALDNKRDEILKQLCLIEAYFNRIQKDWTWHHLNKTDRANKKDQNNMIFGMEKDMK